MSKRVMIKTVIAALIGSTAAPASAGVFADDLSRCLVKKSTEKDRGALVGWIFSAVSSDPALVKFTNLDAEKRKSITSAVANTFERLAFEECRTESVLAVKNEGTDSFEQAFGALGEAAMQQMLTSPAAKAELEALGTYFSKEKMDAFAAEAGIKSAQPAK